MLVVLGRVKKFILVIAVCFIFIILIQFINKYKALADEGFTKADASKAIEQIYEHRNKALINGDLEFIESIYDRNTLYGTWAYEHEIKKSKYITNWSEKQGVKFLEINPKVIIKKITGKGYNFSAYLLCSTEYKYSYENESNIINSFKIGTSHVINLTNKNNNWKISKEWYKDPFADSLNINSLKADDIKQFILNNGIRDFGGLNKRRVDVIDYAEKYCGAASEERYGFKYNNKYRDFNSLGGDCANFASQMLFEGGKFKKNGAWNYERGTGSRAWLNADGFKSYMLYSGRASLIAYGSYEKVVKASYKLLPGDFIAYEKKGDITHISVVTGADSKGYSLVSCHNTDRNKVPWDLGWSDKNIKFWLVRVHY
ncbi:amidase domain-containing protein [Candidatus Clostridium radicumherbarum]|uniref:Amidase domain-containing protein n=1 Tax=Candidatus Clostridium radicumherbarum TaxID=3381662 RepID=A0ABW8TVZ9_9CLOT